jgi:hypothetical protein
MTNFFYIKSYRIFLFMLEIGMSNPFTKKNPLMSMWLAGANRVVGKTRSVMQAAVRRRGAVAGADAAKAVTAFWSGFFSSTSVGKRPKTRQ